MRHHLRVLLLHQLLHALRLPGERAGPAGLAFLAGRWLPRVGLRGSGDEAPLRWPRVLVTGVWLFSERLPASEGLWKVLLSLLVIRTVE